MLRRERQNGGAMRLLYRTARRAMAVVALAGAALASAGAEAEPPPVVASIKPVHALVAGVMAGVGRPRLLLRGQGSPHDYALRPSDARALVRARVVFWVGPDLERFLQKPLKTLAPKARTIALIDAPGVRVLSVRRGGAWGRHAHVETADRHQGRRLGARDPHIWLDPMNAKAMVGAIVTALGTADPPNAAAYRANGKTLVARIERLDAAIGRALAPVRAAPFVVFHDAYQYFEHRYRLAAAGAITISPDRAPGARRLVAIRRTIRTRGARCVFAEPQYRPRLVRTVTEGMDARGAALDPLGARIAPGPDAYFDLMRALSASLVGCLAPKR